MQLIRKHLSKFSLLISLLMLLQGCVAYHKTPVSLEEAVREHTKTMIVLKDGSAQTFKYITNEGDQYFGARLTGNGYVNRPINDTEVSAVRVKNKTGSILLTAIPLAGLAAIFTAGIIGWQ